MYNCLSFFLYMCKLRSHKSGSKWVLSWYDSKLMWSCISLLVLLSPKINPRLKLNNVVISKSKLVWKLYNTEEGIKIHFFSFIHKSCKSSEIYRHWHSLNSYSPTIIIRLVIVLYTLNGSINSCTTIKERSSILHISSYLWPISRRLTVVSLNLTCVECTWSAQVLTVTLYAPSVHHCLCFLLGSLTTLIFPLCFTKKKEKIKHGSAT